MTRTSPRPTTTNSSASRGPWPTPSGTCAPSWIVWRRSRRAPTRRSRGPRRKAGARDALAARIRTFATTIEGFERELNGYQTDEGLSGLRSVAGLDRQYGTLLSNLNGGGGYGGGSTEGPPTEGALQRKRDLDAEWGVISRGVTSLLDGELPALDAELERLGGPGIGG